MNRIRFVLLWPVLALTLWLALASDPTDVRLMQVMELHEQGAFGAADDEETVRLVARVEHLVRITASGTRVVMNGVPKRSVLNVYVADAKHADITRCSRGNAIYDSDLDAIFIDRTLIRPRWLVEAEASGWEAFGVFQEILVHYIILHELGHRQLHGGSRGFYDEVVDHILGAQQREREQDADGYALEQFQRLSEIEDAQMILHEELIGLIELDPEELREEQRMSAVLAIAISKLCDVRSFSMATFSSFHEDVSHPPFLERALRVVDHTLELPDLHPALAAHLSVFKLGLERSRLIQRRGIVEIAARNPVKDIWVSGDHLMLLTEDGGLETVRLESDPVRRGSYMVRRSQVLAPRLEDEHIQHAWGSAAHPVGLTLGGRLFELKAGAWRFHSELSLDGYHVRAVVRDPLQPYRSLIHAASLDDQGQQFTALESSTALQQWTGQEVAGAFRRPDSATTSAIEALGFVGSRPVFLATSESGRAVGMLDFSSGALHKRIELCGLGSLPSGEMLLAGGSDALEVYWIAAVGSPKAAFEGIRVWKIGGVDTPRLIHSYAVEFMGNHIPLGAPPTDARDFDPFVHTAIAGPRGLVAVSVHGDSNYLLNIANDSSGLVFHPGLCVTIPITDNLAASFVDGGSKVYLTRLDVGAGVPKRCTDRIFAVAAVLTAVGLVVWKTRKWI